MAGLRAFILGFLVVGCSTTSPPPSVPPPTADSGALASIDAAIAEWIGFRTAVGLRADEAWVREVAANPASVAGSDTYEIPLLPEEVAFLQGRNQRIEDAQAFGASYAATYPRGFGGAAIDTANGDRLVLQYTTDVALHRLRLTVMPTDIRPEVREAAWTLEQLAEFQAIVNGDTATDPRIKIYGADIDILANHVRVNYIANDRNLGNTLAARFNSTGWLFPVWQGPLDAEGPTGALQIQLVDRSGAPRSGLSCRYVSLDPKVGAGGGVDADALGQCRLEGLPIGPYRIDVLSGDEQVDRVLTSVEAAVVASETQTIRLEVPD